MLVWLGGWGRHPDEQLERHYHRSRARTYSYNISQPTCINLFNQTVHENRIYSLKITCGDNYPDVRPDVQFISRVNLPFVNQENGKVDPNKLHVLLNWSRNLSIENVLVEIRKYVVLSHPHRL